jgi:hypothetical protein
MQKWDICQLYFVCEPEAARQAGVKSLVMVSKYNHMFN